MKSTSHRENGVFRHNQYDLYQLELFAKNFFQKSHGKRVSQNVSLNKRY